MQSLSFHLLHACNNKYVPNQLSNHHLFYSADPQCYSNVQKDDKSALEHHGDNEGHMNNQDHPHIQKHHSSQNGTRPHFMTRMDQGDDVVVQVNRNSKQKGIVLKIYPWMGEASTRPDTPNFCQAGLK